MIVNTTIVFWFELGNWDQCTRAADEFLAESAALGPSYRDADVLACRCWMRLADGRCPPESWWTTMRSLRRPAGLCRLLTITKFPAEGR